jgi:enoyl-CoA hydratase
VNGPIPETTVDYRDFETLQVERSGPGIVQATLNRPDRLNAITDTMFTEIGRLCRRVQADSSARVLLVTGAGRGFCAGLDLDLAGQLPGMPATEFLAIQERWAASSVAALRSLSKPVIAAVHGAAAGAGMSLALAADLRIASTDARFNAAFVRIGLSGGDIGTSWLLPRLVGLGRAYDILLTGRFVGAAEALDMGLVNRVVERSELLAAARALAGQIVGNSPFGMALTKQVVQQNVDAPSLEAAVAVENRCQVLASRTEDMAEALSAFREKRAPVFANR